jgi:hypothetical protein
VTVEEPRAALAAPREGSRKLLNRHGNFQQQRPPATPPTCQLRNRTSDLPSRSEGHPLDTDLRVGPAAERELRGEAQEVAVDLLRELRRRSAGDLKRGLKNNFSNTLDNFWYVIVQPREQALSITVRGKPEMFRPSPLELRVDRPGYTRFKLQTVDQLPEALRIIFWHLNRK